MARLAGYVIPSQLQHIIQRGNNRQAGYRLLFRAAISASNTPGCVVGTRRRQSVVVVRQGEQHWTGISERLLAWHMVPGIV